MARGGHLPVLVGEVLAALDPRPGEVAVDCTVGLGGHAIEIARRLGANGRLIGIDLDAANLAKADTALRVCGCAIAAGGAPESVGRTGPVFSLHQTNFAALPSVLAEAGVAQVDFVLADLGVSSTQIDDPGRGFSYRRPGPLDMRMDPTRGVPASVLLERIPPDELAAALRDLGDEEDAEQIAAQVAERQRDAPIRTTDELTAIVCAARDFTLERAAGAKLHPAARTFQALRMLVNRELPNLERLLAVLPDCLRPGGRAAVISFHSGEDRRVKQAFRDGLRAGIWRAVSAEPIVAGEAERAANPRSRSAKLRWAHRPG